MRKVVQKSIAVVSGSIKYDRLKFGTFFKPLGKGSKIKLIIFAEFSANGGGYPPSVKIINFLRCS